MRWSSGLAGAVVTVGLAVSSVSAKAATVYSQAGNGQACQYTCWFSDQATDGTGGFRTFDNFSLTQSASISTVTWQGFYIDLMGSGGASPSFTQSWNVGFFANSGASPGTQLYSATLPAAQVSAAYVGSSPYLLSTVSVYSFTATLATAFDASANTTYWFSPLSNQPSLNPGFNWSSSAALGGLSSQSTLPGTITGTGAAPSARSNDRAFTLATAAAPAVPGPTAGAGIPALIAAFGGLFWMIRRRPSAA